MVTTTCQHPQRRAASRRSHAPVGFTLVELVICIAIIAILTAMVTPMVTGYLERGRLTVTKDSLVSLAKAMRRFHDDTGSWPSGSGVWNPSMAGTQGQFSAGDTIMFNKGGLASLLTCTSSNGPLAQPCWGGPYLNQGVSLNGGPGPMQDAWGNQFYYAYLQPAPATPAPNGLIVIWSSGPNGVNECTDTTKLARGQASNQSADDLIQVVGSAL